MADVETSGALRTDAAEDLSEIIARLNKFLVEPGRRELLSFAELKVLGASSDVMSHIRGRLTR